MTTTATQTLTPAQFLAARALANAYNHLWSSVSDGTYDVDDIEAYSDSIQHPDLPGGIYGPSLVDEYGLPTVVHQTGSGRLVWKVGISGGVRLEVYRPARTFAYAAIQSVQPPNESGILVAAIDVLNRFPSGESFEVDEVILSTSDYGRSHDEHGQVVNPWNYDPDLQDSLLFERHVAALIRPLVALLAINAEPEPNYRDELEDDEARFAAYHAWHAQKKAWRERVIVPAIAKAKELLAPLFAIALPDPWLPSLFSDPAENPEPETAWRRDGSEYTYTEFEVIHRGNRFPVETEKTAVHAMLLLRQNPEMNMVEAMKAAIRSENHRP